MNFIKEKLTEREEQSVIAHLLRYDEMIKNYLMRFEMRKA